MKKDSLLNSKSIKAQTINTMILTAIQKAFAFVRNAACAAIFGATGQTDAFYMASSIVMLLANAPRTLSAGMIPIRTKEAAEGGEERADVYTNTILNLSLVVAIVFAGLSFVFSPLLVTLFAPGFQGETRSATIMVLRILTPYFILIAVSSTLLGVLNYHKRFYAGSLTGIAFSVVWLAVPLILWRYLGIYAMALGYLAGVAVQVVLLYLLLRGNFKYSFQFNYNTPAVKKTLLMCVPIFISMGASMINQTVDKILASGLPDGSVSALSYSQQLMSLVSAIIMEPIMMVAYTSLSKYAQSNQMKELKELVIRVMSVIILIMIPVTVYFIMFGDAVVSIVFGRGEFDSRAIYLTCIPLSYYSIGFVFGGFTGIINSAFQSFLDTKTPMIASFVGVIINIVLNIILVKYMGIGGLALATSISGIVSVFILIVLIRKKLGPMGFSRLAVNAVKIVLAAVALIGVAYLLKTYVNSHMILKAAISLVGSGITYILLLIILRQEDVLEALTWGLSFIKK